MGAIKAGVTIVTYQEKDEIDALNQTLKDSGAKGLMFSPQTVISQETNGQTVTRQSYLQKLLPELHSLYPGDELQLKNYPNLKQIIQLGHTSIRGVIKFKDAMVYANPKLSNLEIPENSTSDAVYEAYKGGRNYVSYTNGELASHADSLWNNHFNSSHNEIPVYMSLDLETPLALSTFIANNANFRKVYIPATFNVSKIFESMNVQKSDTLVCDQDFYQMEPPKEKLNEYEGYVSHISKVIVASTDGKVGKSPLYKGEVVTMDPYKFA